MVHCGVCNKVVSSRCISKKHVVQCPIHKGVYCSLDRPCPTCKGEHDAAERRRKEAARRRGK
ncbi:hypothetical protein EXIGLDRAFT_737324 [Exidia glandulosa HHB12029]|uniref:Uncharacterized protein n=1 Tax=Exidia glandulosa HHB12029 TaxID=1314781 RepID=A0A166AQG9_EXIGL|nr:hypothetical protein EXIGLDRAFT_737324 [Exidia glandulosa HHB12029]